MSATKKASKKNTTPGNSSTNQNTSTVAPSTNATTNTTVTPVANAPSTKKKMTLVADFADFEERIIFKWKQLKQSAQDRNKDFKLTLEDIRKLMLVKKCYYLEVQLEDNYYDQQKATPNERTIDRIDNNKGYVKGNVVACSRKANQLKNMVFESGFSHPDEVIMLIEKVKGLLPKKKKP